MEDWVNLTVPPGLTGNATSLDVSSFPGFTKEMVRAEWRLGDPLELWIMKPVGVKNPPVILYLYSFPTNNYRYAHNDFCQFLTQNGFAAVGFVSALTGPRRDWRAEDLTLWCAGGICAINGGGMDHPEMPPLKAHGSQSGFQGGVHAAVATMGAVMAAMRDGEGQEIDVSIQESLAAQLELFFEYWPYMKMIATRLTEAARDVPTFPLSIDIVIDALLAQRSDFNAGKPTRVSVNDLLIKACALALKQTQAVNSSYTPLGIVQHRHADVAMAVATKFGLITPIIFAAEDKTILQIAAAARDLSERGRAGRLKADEYVGGTFTISNLGMFGIRSFASIINPPHSAILSVGAAKPSVIVADTGETRTATLMNVTMTCDHRVVDGATGAQWLKVLRGLLESPAALFQGQ